MDPGEIPSLHIITDDLLPESVISNSPLTAQFVPRCQGALGTLSDKVFRANGCCVRLDVQGEGIFIVTPAHVLAGITGDVYLLGSVRPIKFDPDFTLKDDVKLLRKRIVIDTDVVALQISESEASSCGLSMARILLSVPDFGTLASICGPNKLGSTGVLVPDTTVFGGLVYSGSTVGGFSGAVYMVGDQAAGIHIAGGRRNVGYSLRLAYVTLCCLVRHSPEESVEWLETLYKRYRKRIQFDETWGDVDTARIKVNGQYSIVSKETLAQVVGDGKEWKGTISYDDSSASHSKGPKGKGGKHVSWRDQPRGPYFEPHSAETELESADQGNSQVTTLPGASSSQTTMAPVITRIHLDEIAARAILSDLCKTVTRKEFAQFRTETMDGPEKPKPKKA